MTQEEKDKAAQLLADNYLKQWQKLMQIEPRLCDYINFMRLFPNRHNAYEILGAVKFLRLLRTYEQDIE